MEIENFKKLQLKELDALVILLDSLINRLYSMTVVSLKEASMKVIFF